MSEAIYQYINQMNRADFERFRELAGTASFASIIGEIRAESAAGEFRQQCQSLGIPDIYLDTTEKLITLAYVIAGRYVHEK